MTFNWNYPTTVWVGENRIKDLTQACIDLKINKPLLVTDKDLVNLTMIKNVTSEVKKNFNELNIFSNFSGNPVGENVEEGVDEFKKNNCDGVIAIGGGSGTLSEICAAYMYSKPIVVLKNSGGTSSKFSDQYLDHRKNVKIIGVETPKDAVKVILEEIKLD